MNSASKYDPGGLFYPAAHTSKNTNRRPVFIMAVLPHTPRHINTRRVEVLSSRPSIPNTPRRMGNTLHHPSHPPRRDSTSQILFFIGRLPAIEPVLTFVGSSSSDPTFLPYGPIIPGVGSTCPRPPSRTSLSGNGFVGSPPAVLLSGTPVPVSYTHLTLPTKRIV